MDGILELNGNNETPEWLSQYAGDFSSTGSSPLNISQYLDANLVPVISPDEIIVVVQNCGNVGLAAIKTLLV